MLISTFISLPLLLYIFLHCLKMFVNREIYGFVFIGSAIGDSFTKESGQIVNLNAKNRSGQTPLITAVVCNNLKV